MKKETEKDKFYSSPQMLDRSFSTSYIGKEEWETVQLADKIHPLKYADWKVQSKIELCFRVVFSLFSCT